MNRPHSARKPRPPLDKASLQELALFYVGRFATSRGKLVRYLDRKVRERGWEGGDEAGAAVHAVADRIAELGYVDDAAYAATRSRVLSARGLGPRRLSADLSAAGIGEADRNEAKAGFDAAAAAMRFAERKRLGPFGLSAPDPKLRDKQLGAMLRAGHSFDHARRIIDCEPGEMPDFS